MSEALTDTVLEEREEELTFPATLPVLPLKDMVVFPASVTPLAIGQERSIKLVEDVVSGSACSRSSLARTTDAEQPGWDDLYEVGTAAVIHKMITVPDGTLRILVQGSAASTSTRPITGRPLSDRRVQRAAGRARRDAEVEALTRNVQNLFARVIGLVAYLPAELQLAAANVDDPSALCHLVASTLRR